MDLVKVLGTFPKAEVVAFCLKSLYHLIRHSKARRQQLVLTGAMCVLNSFVSSSDEKAKQLALDVFAVISQN